MDALAIIALVSKGITIISALVEAGQNAWPAIYALKQTFVGKVVVTKDDLDRCEAVLDALIDEFNSDLPPP